MPVVYIGKGQQKPRVSGSLDPDHIALAEYVVIDICYGNKLGKLSVSTEKVLIISCSY